MTRPIGWRAATLAELASNEPNAFVDGPFGSHLKTSHYTDSGPRVLRLENIGDGVFRDVLTHISDGHFRTLLRHEARAGDIVMALLGEEVPRAVVVPAHVGPAVVKADCPRLRVCSEIADSFFVAYALNAPQTRHQAKALVHGVGRPRLNVSEARELSIPLPPLAEQRRIVEALETHFTRLDVVVSTLARIRMSLRRYRASVLLAAVEGRLTRDDGAPPGGNSSWRQTSVDDEAEDVRFGTSARTTDRNDGVPILRMGNIQDGEIDAAKLKFLPEAQVESELYLESGDLLFNRTNSPELVGKCAVYRGAPTPCSYASYLIRVRLKATCNPEFLAMWINSAHGRRWVREVVVQQVGQANVNGTKLRAFRFRLPDPCEQEAIVNEVRRHLSIIDATRKSAEAALTRCARLRQALLRTALEGSLVPQNPNDEPADSLLARLRAERDACPPAARRRGRPRQTRRHS